jgi:ABC-2 type transport system ATP-binding protein
MISCRQLIKDFGDTHAVSGVSFEIGSGRICALLGPNGAGKSTIVKILAGLLPATSGAAEICGLAASDGKLKALIGVLPESLALFDALTIGEHLELTGAVYKLDRAEVRMRSDQLLRLLRLQNDRGTFIHECSYGMKKKTSLGMALLPNPRVLFLDEPFEGIDPITAETIRVQLQAAARRGVTVLLTSHILSLVDRIADQVIMINRGVVVFDGETAELPKALEELYFDLVEYPSGDDLQWLGSAAS